MDRKGFSENVEHPIDVGIHIPIMEVAISQRSRKYRISEIGRWAISKFTNPDYRFTVTDLGHNDRVTVSVTLDIGGEVLAHVYVDLPAKLLEESDE